MDNELGENIIMLTDENGEEVYFEFLYLIEYDAEEYVVLLPVGDDDGTVVILKTVDSGLETESYVSVEDEDVLNRVFEIFKEHFKAEFMD